MARLKINKNETAILLANCLYILIFGSILFGEKKFVGLLSYLLVIGFGVLMILTTKNKFQYPVWILWGLTLWGFMHFAGGTLTWGNVRLYDLLLWPITPDIFRYDQLVHIIGFGFATTVVWRAAKQILKPTKAQQKLLIVIIILAGLGVGAVNEIIEFIAWKASSQILVGDYTNNSLDLVADLIGATIATLLMYFSGKKKI